jgi:hypothetical protein
MTMDDDKTTTTNEDGDRGSDKGAESWLAEQARLVLLEDGS